jgi:hypothetical protein
MRHQPALGPVFRSPGLVRAERRANLRVPNRVLGHGDDVRARAFHQERCVTIIIKATRARVGSLQS